MAMWTNRALSLFEWAVIAAIVIVGLMLFGSPVATSVLKAVQTGAL
jgi:hypothetical protein